MASPMNNPGHQLYYRSRRKHNPGNSDIPQATIFNDHNQKNGWYRTARLNSVKVAARDILFAIRAWFVPRQSNPTREAMEEDLYKAKDVSISSVKSAGSNNSSRKFKYSGSFDPNPKQLGSMKFSITDICKATGNFSLANRIGQGGFGTVYRGKFNDGTLVAVKRAKKNTSDQHVSKEFKNEIQTLSGVEHLNLVRFLGYLEENDERIIVVEYVGNGTLREHLDGARGEGLEISERLDIAIDVAHAVTYLHMYTDHPIIHRDIKATNILITENFRAKVADFGFARLAANDPAATHISTQIKGTAGYLDPEYLKTYQLTEKSDVYSFGVLLVELMTGRHPIEPKRELKSRITTRWAMQKFTEGNAIVAMDPRIRRSPEANLAVEKVLELAHKCLAPSRNMRPSMKKCAETLWRIRKDFRETRQRSSASSRRSENLIPEKR